MKVKSQSEVAQSCPTLSDPIDCSLPGSSVHRIFQARVLEWGAIAFSDFKVHIDIEVTQSCPTLCNPLDYNLPGSSVHGIFQAESWSGLPFPPPGDLPDPGIEPGSPAFQADVLTSEPPGDVI